MVYLKVGKDLMQNIRQGLPDVGASGDRGGPRAPT
jgi:hypothetical protein